MRRPLRCFILTPAVLLLGFAAATAQKDEFKLSKDEQAILDLINAQREKAEKPPLKANGQLTEAARGHAVNMAKQKKMDHVLDDKGPADRVKEIGYKYKVTGENVAMTPKLNPQQAVKVWMNSPPHKANILSEKFAYEETGIGLARDTAGKVYYCQVFGTPKK